MRHSNRGQVVPLIAAFVVFAGLALIALAHLGGGAVDRAEAKRAAEHFTAERIPKFLGYFETVLARQGRSARYLAGGRVSYADLSLFQSVAGLRYAFPKTMKRAEKKLPRVVALHDRVSERPRIAAYLASPRRLAFNESGIFRHYPELDRT